MLRFSHVPVLTLLIGFALQAQFIAQSIGQAFQVAYMEFLRANGIDDPRALRAFDYEEVLNSQQILGDELEMFARKDLQKDVRKRKRQCTQRTSHGDTLGESFGKLPVYKTLRGYAGSFAM